MNLQEEMLKILAENTTTSNANMPDSSIQEIEHFNAYDASIKISEIAERNAIEFAEWIYTNITDSFNEDGVAVWYIYQSDFHTIKQLYKLFPNSKDNE